MVSRRTFLTLAGAALPASGLPVAAAQTAEQTAAADKERITRQVWTSYYAKKIVWGYADKHSVAPGETFDLLLSTGPDVMETRGVVEIYRIGHHPDQEQPDRKLVYRSALLDV